MIVNMNITSMEYLLIIIFIISVTAIIIEWKLNYPLGFYDGIVLCLIPPFIKRIRIYKNRWVGFDKNWKFIYMKELEEKI